MRKFIVLILSCAMLAAGIYTAVDMSLFADVPQYRLAVTGATLALLGGYLIWTDFVAPRLGIQTWED
jgi:hypothetical protein